MKDIELKADTSELSAFWDGLLADLSDVPEEVREFFLNLGNLPAELVCFECGVTSGAVVTVLLKPSQRLVDFGAAIRARNFDFVFVEQSHGFSFVDSGLVELPILPTSEKPSD